ncbi:hypothetical protein LAZ67_12002037 [Cordylochernes scorpioides]|uniref:Uncharacterized protein n=1 Tax=Cordylochernes scorpioides TaxID=51811 RepID=A0ABY6L1H4_9ARAC|nr:hypothetical protein LAZ67_12002037 [Cordylochernes scorpioides]
MAFRHTRLVFGLNCSPFLLNVMLTQSFYMDNCVASLETKLEVQEFQRSATEIIERAKMNLNGWEYSFDDNPSEEPFTKALRLIWNKRECIVVCQQATDRKYT